ncbi:MAG: DUF1924 domain-containing protein [Gallionellaceae bacterium]
MVNKLGSFALALLISSGFMAQVAFAQTPEEILATLKTEAKATAGFQNFSAARGETFFKEKHGGEWSCTSCHTDNTTASGKHAKTGKVIQPLAPSANAERFTDPAKVEKWFKRNCNDVLSRVCTPQEKGDVLAHLLTVKK